MGIFSSKSATASGSYGYGYATQSRGSGERRLKPTMTEEVDKNPEHFKIIMVVDESGSMQGIRDDIIGSINTFITEQQKEKGTVPLLLP